MRPKLQGRRGAEWSGRSSLCGSQGLGAVNKAAWRGPTPLARPPGPSSALHAPPPPVRPPGDRPGIGSVSPVPAHISCLHGASLEPCEGRTWGAAAGPRLRPGRHAASRKGRAAAAPLAPRRAAADAGPRGSSSMERLPARAGPAARPASASGEAGVRV